MNSETKTSDIKQSIKEELDRMIEEEAQKVERRQIEKQELLDAQRIISRLITKEICFLNSSIAMHMENIETHQQLRKDYN